MKARNISSPLIIVGVIVTVFFLVGIPLGSIAPPPSGVPVVPYYIGLFLPLAAGCSSLAAGIYARKRGCDSRAFRVILTAALFFLSLLLVSLEVAAYSAYLRSLGYRTPSVTAIYINRFAGIAVSILAPIVALRYAGVAGCVAVSAAPAYLQLLALCHYPYAEMWPMVVLQAVVKFAEPVALVIPAFYIARGRPRCWVAIGAVFGLCDLYAVSVPLNIAVATVAEGRAPSIGGETIIPLAVCAVAVMVQAAIFLRRRTAQQDAE